MAENSGTCSSMRGMKERENFGSRLGMLMAMTGSAVGLGNIWRFPYLVGTNGGAAFIAIYLVCSVVLCIPVMLSEFMIGRRSRKSAYMAYDTLAPGTLWKWAGPITVICPLMVLSFYDVVGGWSVQYFIKSLTFSFPSDFSNEAASRMFSSFISSDILPLLTMLAFLTMTATIVFFGVKSGIEAFGKVMMPVLFFVILAIAVWTMLLPGASAGLEFMFKPDFSKIDMKVCLSAMGQAFFSLSLGAGTMLTYASYANSSVDINKSSLQIAGMDVLFAIVAGCAILPATFAYGMDPGQGPGLIFETLPMVFSKMPLGSVIAIFFFGSVMVAALTSTVSQYEVAVAFLAEEKGYSRKKAVLLVYVAMIVTGVLCSLSFGSLSDVKIFGKTLFDFFDFTSANVLIPIGAMFACLFVGWKMKKPDVRDEFTNSGSIAFNQKIYPLVYFLIRYVAPVGIAVVALSNVIF